MSRTGRIATLGLAAMLALASTGAGASVVYHWTTISPSPDFAPLDGTLEISDAAWRAGSLDYAFTQLYGMPGDAGSPLIASLFSISTDGYGLDIDIFPRAGTNNQDSTVRAHLVFDRLSGLLAGSLYANNTESDYSMDSDASGSLWTFGSFNTDATMGWGCGITGACSGATGFWTLDARTIPVPEPGSAGLWLFGVALLGLGLRLRRGRA